MGIRKGLPAKLALTDADDTRYDFKNLVVSNADGSPRGGLIAPVGASLITGTATMDVSIGAFAAAAVRDGGVILLSSDGAQAVTIGAAPSSNQRTDIVYAKQNDASSTVSTPDANNTPVLGVAIGAAGPSGGTPAALPVGAVEVGRVILSAGNTNTNAAVITQSRQFTASPGGTVPVDVVAYLSSWTNALPGQKAYVFGDTPTYRNGDYEFNGTAWKFVGDAVYDIVPSAPWVAGTGPNKPRIIIKGGIKALKGNLGYAAGAQYSSFFTLPADLRPPTISATRDIGTGSQVTGVSLIQFNAQLTTAGVVGQGGGATGSLPASGVVKLTGIVITDD